MADNYTRFGERLQQLVQDFVTDPLCSNHYEYDIQWSILQFLLDVSKNPVAGLAENKNRNVIDDDGVVGDEELLEKRKKQEIMNELITSLIRHNIPVERKPNKRTQSAADESDLSVN